MVEFIDYYEGLVEYIKSAGRDPLSYRCLGDDDSVSEWGFYMVAGIGYAEALKVEFPDYW